MLCLHASQIWSHPNLWSHILQMVWTVDIYLNRVCTKVYEIAESSKYKSRSSSGDWEGQFIENDSVQI